MDTSEDISDVLTKPTGRVISLELRRKYRSNGRVMRTGEIKFLSYLHNTALSSGYSRVSTIVHRISFEINRSPRSFRYFPEVVRFKI